MCCPQCLNTSEKLIDCGKFAGRKENDECVGNTGWGGNLVMNLDFAARSLTTRCLFQIQPALKVPGTRRSERMFGNALQY